MIQNTEVYGDDLVKFAQSAGCDIKNEFGEHVVLWSVFTGSYFIIPKYEKSLLDTTTIKHIIWHMGLSEEAFMEMWKK